MKTNTKDLTAKSKLSFTSYAASAVYLVPTLAQSAVVIGVGAPVGIDHNAAVGVAGQVFWDIDSDGNNDLNFYRDVGALDLNMDTNDPFAGALNGRGLVQSNGMGGDQMQNLATGFIVGPTLTAAYQWGASQQASRTMVNTTGTALGADMAGGGWAAGGGQYFGFRFSRAGQTHYGWAEINFDLGGAPGGVHITRWAWENQPNTAIAVVVAAVAKPIPTLSIPALGLSILALGAAGIRRMRKAKNNPSSVA
ncbi:MAG: hypothetical protein QM500_07410 [Methylococcales bacterium]